MKNLRALLPALALLALAGCGGHHHHNGGSSSAFEGNYTGTFSEQTHVSGTTGATGTFSGSISSGGTITGTTTDSRYTGNGTVQSGSKVNVDGTATLIVTYASNAPAATTTMSGTFVVTDANTVSGTLTEEVSGGGMGATFGYALTRATN